MADFKKIDDDAVGSDEPLDAYALQRTEENLSAVRAKRPRRFAWGWPADHKHDRPILACHKSIVYLLGRWPVTPGVLELTVRIHYKVVKTTAHINVGLLSASGVSIADLTTVAPGTYSTNYTVDVSSYQGGLADLVLVMRSDSVNPVVESYSNHECIKAYSLCDLDDGGGTSFPWTSGDRWVMEWLEPTGSPGNQDGDSYPGKRTVAWINGTDDDKVYAYPGFMNPYGDRPWQEGGYRIQVSELAYIEMYGVAIEESQLEWDALRNSLLPGRSPTALACGRLYQRARRFFVEQTRVHHCGPSFDLQTNPPSIVTQPTLLWGEMSEYSTSYVSLVSTVVGRYDTSSLEGVVRERTTLKIAGFVQAVMRSGHELKLTLRARLLSFDTGLFDAWDGGADADMTGNDAPVISDELELVVGARSLSFADQDPQGLLMGLTASAQGTPSWHTLRGAMDYGELNSRTSAGLVPFELTVADEVLGHTARLLEIQWKGDTNTLGGEIISLGGFADGIQSAVVCPVWSVWTSGTTSGIS